MDANPRSVLASGFVALDVVRRDQGVWIRAGGTAGNVAANLAYFGWKARIAGLIGCDEAGHIVNRDLLDAGVDTSNLYQHDQVGTPLVLHEIHGKTHRFRFGCSVCGRPHHQYRPLGPAKVSKLLSSERLADVFFFDRPRAAALTLAEAHAKAGRLVVYEPSSAGNPSAHMRAAACADVIKYSEEQAAKFEKYLPESPPNYQLRIVTRGENGVLYRLGPEAWREQPTHSVSAVDAGGGRGLDDGCPHRLLGTSSSMAGDRGRGSCSLGTGCGGRELPCTRGPTSCKHSGTKGAPSAGQGLAQRGGSKGV
jgi:sugar/nucleoside kinase (ribokinase family)